MAPWITIVIAVFLVIFYYLYQNLHIFLRYVTQLLINSSRLHITSMNIANPSPSGFNLSLAFKITDAGPFEGVKISDFEVALSAESGGPVFSTMKLPNLTIESSQCSSSLRHSPILVSDIPAFNRFNENLLNQNEVPMYLSARPIITLPIPFLSLFLPQERASITIEGIKLEKTVIFTAMKRLEITVIRSMTDTTSKNPTKLAIEVSILNSSIVGIEVGLVVVSLIIDGTELVELAADGVHLEPGPNKVIFKGTLKLQKALGSVGLQFLKREAKSKPTNAIVIGKRGRDDVSWIDHVVRKIDSPIVINSTLKEIYQSM